MNKTHTAAHMEGQQLWTDLTKANAEIKRLHDLHLARTKLTKKMIDQRDEARVALEQARQKAIIDNQEKISAVAHITRLEAALDIYEGIVADSRGVDGWHLNGDIAEWDEFELPEIEKSVLTAGDTDENSQGQK